MQEQSARGSGGAGGRSRAGGEDARNLAGGELAAPDIDHRSDQVAHHVMEKSVAANAIDEEIAVGSGAVFPCRGKDSAHGGARCGEIRAWDQNIV